MTGRRTRVRVPPRVKRGEVIEIKTLIAHPMETGNRRDDSGQFVPRDIVHRFRAIFDGETVFEAELNTGIAANPYLAFFLRVDRSGILELVWDEDDGRSHRKTAPIEAI